MRQDYDNPWKEVIEEHFRLLAALLLSWIERDVDWSHAPESREQELRRAHPRTAAGKRLVDKLLRLMKRTGDTRHLHVELQSYPEEDFGHRVWQYNKDAGSLVGEEVVTVVVLVDDDPEWRPDEVGSGEWLRLFDWQLQLPEDAEARVSAHLAKKRREGIMPFVASFDKYLEKEAIEKSLKDGMEKGLKDGIEKARKETRLDGVDLPTLEAVYAALKTPAPLEQIVALLP